MDPGEVAAGPPPGLPRPSSRDPDISLRLAPETPDFVSPERFPSSPDFVEGILRSTSNCVKFLPRFLSGFCPLTCSFAAGTAHQPEALRPAIYAFISGQPFQLFGKLSCS